MTCTFSWPERDGGYGTSTVQLYYYHNSYCNASTTHSISTTIVLAPPGGRAGVLTLFSHSHTQSDYRTVPYRTISTVPVVVVVVVVVVHRTVQYSTVLI